jgi:hypothetical protein
LRRGDGPNTLLHPAGGERIVIVSAFQRECRNE